MPENLKELHEQCQKAYEELLDLAGK